MEVEISEHLIRDLLDAAPDATVVVDRHGKIVLANTQIKNVFGYEPRELIGASVEVLMPDRFRNKHALHREAYHHTAQPRPMDAGLELYGLRKNGEEFPVEISLGPVQSNNGLLVSGAIRDVTKQKLAKQELIHVRNEANKANRAKSVFLATASHDLRQPMQTLRILNHVLAQIAVDERMIDAIHTQEEALDGMTELLNALLDMSKLESGTVVPDIQDCSVKAIFEHLRAKFEQQAQAKGLKLLVEECDEVARSDPGLLEQLVQNLLANAIRYTRKGLVQLRCLRDAGSLRIEVLDTGIGISGSHMESIWEEFYQVENNSSNSKEGWGLGLSIVKRLSDLLNHPLDIKSKPGEGSCFAVTIPASGNAVVKQVERTTHNDTDPVEDATIIIIDDDPQVLKAHGLLFELKGYTIMTASSGNDAAEQMKNREVPPSVIITDYYLGRGETGDVVINKLREITRQDTPAIVLTGDTTLVMQDITNTISNCHVESKPTDIHKLFDLLSKAVNTGEI